jgi:hypothetical protein
MVMVMVMVMLKGEKGVQGGISQLRMVEGVFPVSNRQQQEIHIYTLIRTYITAWTGNVEGHLSLPRDGLYALGVLEDP